MQELTGLDSKWATTLMAQHLLAAADRYGLDRLRLMCEASLCEDVAINTVATTLALAEQHHCFQLKAVCLKFIARPENLRGLLIELLYCHASTAKKKRVQYRGWGPTWDIQYVATDQKLNLLLTFMVVVHHCVLSR